jgi:ParB/RepB/Spo0J family partition protein
MSTTAAVSAERTIALELIDCPANVRELDLAHVDALAGSIALRGLIVPLVVRPAGEGRFTLVAGFHRHAACQRSGVDQVPVVVRDEDGESADRAAENVVRKALTPLEEARAVKAMLDQGYTLDGAASVLGWARQRVSSRAKLLELPERAQQLVGDGTVPVSGVDAFVAIAAVSRPLCELVADAIAEAEEQGSELGSSFAHNPGWVVQQTLGWQQRCRGRVWAAYLTSTDATRLEELKLGKNAEQLLAEAEQLDRKLSPYGYGPPAIEFAESDARRKEWPKSARAVTVFKTRGWRLQPSTQIGTLLIPLSDHRYCTSTSAASAGTAQALLDPRVQTPVQEGLAHARLLRDRRGA